MPSYRSIVGAVVAGTAVGLAVLSGPASASDWPTLDPQPAKCVTGKPPAAGEWCTYFNPGNPSGQWLGAKYHPAGSFESLALCMQYQQLVTWAPYDKSWCGVTIDSGYPLYYNLYLRSGAKAPGTGTTTPTTPTVPTPPAGV